MEESNINPEETELDTLKKQHEELKTKHSKCLKQIDFLKDEIHKIKNEPNNDDPMDDTDDSVNEEQILLNGKKSGFTRDGPQSKPIPKQLPKSIPCEHCDNNFESQIELQQHMLKHTNDDEWNCDMCD